MCVHPHFIHNGNGAPAQPCSALIVIGRRELDLANASLA
jgi:hypothetical protein